MFQNLKRYLKSGMDLLAYVKIYHLHYKLYVIEDFNGMLYVFSFHLLSSCNILIVIIHHYIRLIAS